MAYVYRIGREAAQASIAKYAHHLVGKCLDVGASSSKGRYSGMLHNITSYTSLDIDPKTHPDIVADAEAMTELSAASFDSILCTQVLYAVPHPYKAIGEFHRVLKQGGVALITVPFVNLWIGEHDHWRFTPTSIRLLLVEQGFEVIAMENTGVGIWSVTHQLFVKFIKAGLGLNQRNVTRKIFNRLFAISAKMAIFLDKLFKSNTNNQFFLDVTVLARKV